MDIQVVAAPDEIPLWTSVSLPDSVSGGEEGKGQRRARPALPCSRTLRKGLSNQQAGRRAADADPGDEQDDFDARIPMSEMADQRDGHGYARDNPNKEKGHSEQFE
ncbi:hypothetical protein GCM10009799_41110 [Nocardiopsis rhodophaea]|uniref:Uncharacterized protein n=1 Tax=Nocardiopsis rhodophaea TaxID=280238 RepID=A0ABP5EV90_9ACTN